MKIDKLSLVNYKAFQGEYVISNLTNDLNNDQNIILFGGLNGAGKTSIFEAILLCLYGKKNETLWPSRGARHEGYQSYIISIINNQAKYISPTPEMRISVLLKNTGAEDPLSESVSVSRKWKIIDNNLEDQFFLYDSNGEPLKTIPEDSWQEYIEEIIPYEVHQFFFFDGEKIQDFIKDEDEKLKNSLSTVLGINLYSKLKEDLSKAKKDIISEESKGKQIGIEIDEKRADLSKFEKEIHDKKGKIDDQTERIHEIDREIDEINRETHRINPNTKVGSNSATLEEKEGLLHQKGELNNEMSQFIQLDLIFLFMGDLSFVLSKQLADEKKKIEFESKQKGLKPKIHTLLNQLFSGEESRPPLHDSQKKFYKDKLNNMLEDILIEGEEKSESVKIIHGLSEQDANDIISKIKNTMGDIEPINEIVRDLNRIDAQLKNIKNIESSLSGPGIEALIEKRGKLREEKKQLESSRENLKIEIDKLKYNTQSLKQKITNKENEVELNPERERQREYIDQIIETLDDFSKEFRSSRIHQLEELSYQMWNKLAHKEDLVKKIKIDEGNFSIELINSKSQSLDKTKLSAGEKEILALSLIWALGRLTDRNLPVIIDTPFGRLDGKHRESIAKNYFPNVSEQVFLLSTEKEIIGNEYEAIEPSLRKKYMIEHNPDLQTSQIREGYFQ